MVRNLYFVRIIWRVFLKIHLLSHKYLCSILTILSRNNSQVHLSCYYKLFSIVIVSYYIYLLFYLVIWEFICIVWNMITLLLSWNVNNYSFDVCKIIVPVSFLSSQVEFIFSAVLDSHAIFSYRIGRI